MIDDIAVYLAAQGLGIIEKNLFKGSMPDKPDSCIGVFEYSGSPPDLAHDGAEIENPGLQIRVRDKSYATGRTKIESIIRALHPSTNITMGTTFYLSITVNQSPIPLGSDQNGRQEWSVNFTVNKNRN
jgi:hypothetical protein